MGKTIYDWAKELDPDGEIAEPYSVMKFAIEYSPELEAKLRQEQQDHDDELLIFKGDGYRLVALGDGFIIELY